MERNQTTVMASLTSLREELGNVQGQAFQNTSLLVALNQAFDRLFLGYQNGIYDDAAAESGIAEIRAKMSSLRAPSVQALRPMAGLERERVLARNYQSLAERMLEQAHGTWDSRHVEIVQGAISHLSRSDAGQAQSLASSLQKRMSESVWAGNLELADTVSQIREESQSLQASIQKMISERENALKTTTSDVDDSTRVLASEADVRRMVENAGASVMQRRMQSDFEALKVSREYADTLKRQVFEQRQNQKDSEEIRRAQDGIKQAAEKLMAGENARFEQTFKGIVKSIASSVGPEDALKLSQIPAGGTVSERISSLRSILKGVAGSSAQIQNALRELDGMQWRTSVLGELANGQSSPENIQDDHREKEAQMLDARMMYEQKRMQFEQNHAYSESSADMLKALDYEVPAATFENAWVSAMRSAIQNNIQRVRQIAQSAHSGDVGVYAPIAGSEYARNAQNALKMADSVTPNVTAIPTLQSETAKRTNQVLHDVRQLAFHPSVRSEMGFAASRSQLDEASQKPLFKRVRFSKDNKDANELLPSLYRVAGLKLNKADSPLRKSFKDLNLRAANLELVKMIEDQFDPSASGRVSDKVSGVASDVSQRKDVARDAKGRVVGIISDWVDKRHDRDRESADTSSLVKTGRLKGGALENSLKSEAMQLPSSVQNKLSPFLGFDLSSIKIYAGPIAAMASEAMGAHAFTLGKSVFLGQNKLNFESAEGLGLLAHELLHTSHFGAGDSVESKEQAAEAMEARVKKAFGSEVSPSLALEKDKSKATSGKADQKSSAVGTVPAGTVGARQTYDVDEIFDTVCEKVVALMYESFRLESERKGNQG